MLTNIFTLKSATNAQLPLPSSSTTSNHFISKILRVAFTLIKPTTVYAEAPAPTHMEKEYAFSYLDSFGLNKNYLAGESRLVRAANTPFEEEILEHLIGKGDRGKIKVRETTSAVEVPMKNQEGHHYLVRSHFVHYRGPKGQVTIMPNGEVDLSESQHMKRNMLPGMARKPGEFVEFEIPQQQMQQIVKGTFSSFIPLSRH